MRAFDYVPFVSIAKGVYYIKKANEKNKIINDIVQEKINQRNQGLLTPEDADVQIEYAKIYERNIKAIKIRGELACIPIIGNLFLTWHDIKGCTINGGYADSLKAMSELNI